MYKRQQQHHLKNFPRDQDSFQLVLLQNKTQKIFCGEISKKKLTQKIDNQIVKCFIEKNNDRYNRILAECFVNNESLSVYMVKNGYAFDYVKYSKKKYQEYENFAKKNKLGLWKTKFEYPWLWRKKNR